MYEYKGWGCHCKKNNAASLDMDRRSFLKASALAAGAAGVAAARAGEAEETGQTLEEWSRGLFEKGETRLYRGEELKNIAMPMGGIGAGQVYLRGDGCLGPWQIVNNFNSEAFVSGAYFGFWARTSPGAAKAVLLQKEGAHGLPGVSSLTFSGEYPFAWISYELAECPVKVSLEAYSPMIPLDAKDSGLPLTIFRFTLKNQTDQPVDASLLATAPNLAGWEGYTRLECLEAPGLGWNINESMADQQASHVVLRGAKGEWPALATAAGLVTNEKQVVQDLRLCKNLDVRYHSQLHSETDSGKTVFWMGSFSETPSEQALGEVLEKVKNGASLILCGADQGLLAYTANPRKKRSVKGKTFEDWESGRYDYWTISGNAFGDRPALGEYEGQQKISGERGKFFVNSFQPGDAGTGRLRSKTFKIKSDYIHLLVGGGKKPGVTCVNLVVDGQTILSAYGQDTERLSPVCWNVASRRGKAAHIEIVDESTEGWGHVLADDIIFSDLPLSPFANPKLVGALRDVLPFRYSSMRQVTEVGRADLGALHPSLKGKPLTAPACWKFRLMRMRPGSEVLLKTTAKVPLIVAGTYGKGKVIFCNGDPARWSDPQDRVIIMGALVALALDTAYTAQTGWPEDHPFQGSMALSALGEEACAAAQWVELETLWKPFAATGRVEPSESIPSLPGRTWNAALAVPVTLRPGESRDVRFALAWHFPNRTRNERYGWGPAAYQYDYRLGNQYNNHFRDALDVARYAAENLERLEGGTRKFHAALYDSTLPRWFIECVSANASITRSPIYVWLEDGAIGGFEGSDSCCPMNCTHVYNYAMSMAYLYPALERNVRETDLLRQMNPESHYIPHRTVLPLSLPRLGNEIGGPYHHALDGELGTLLKTYREWRMCGDRAWLRALWPNAKLVMEHILRDHDTDGNGAIRGEQPNTYDTHLFGSNTFIGTLYLAALRAMEEMAGLMGDREFAARCRARFEQGSAVYNERCWNGEYYVNVFDAPGATPETYNDQNCYGPGCHADQLLGQWWAHLLGLGYLLPPERVKSALNAIYKYSWRQNFAGHVQQPRRFADDDEKGLLICTWPNGGRPEKPILYSDEIWTGIEYHVAATMIYEGMIEPAFHIIRGARDRYTGTRRNPWSEIECGGHYARAMSSYSLLHAAAGLEYDAGSQSLRIQPRINPGDFRCFFTASHGWGNLALRREVRSNTATIDIKQGRLSLRRLVLPGGPRPPREMTISGGPACAINLKEGLLVIDFRNELAILPDRPLTVIWHE